MTLNFCLQREREKRSGDISAKQVCICFIGVTHLGTIHGEVLHIDLSQTDHQTQS